MYFTTEMIIWRLQKQRSKKADCLTWNGIEIDVNEVHKSVELNVDVPTMY
jgi:hypothetical protein